ncbi:MAG: hypothetical protein IT258_13220 [Saprospiraceae bacterium]|nr:hypothetical protein [Saprospiraceae bacterium]
MFKSIIFLAAFLPSVFGFDAIAPTAPDCACTAVANVQKTGQGSGSISFAWFSSSDATQYKIWYVRQSDGYTSANVLTTSSNHTFTGLAAGQYTFYFVKVCGGESSGYVGIEEIICI